MEKQNDNSRNQFLKKEVEEYMKNYSITDINFFLTKTPEEMMQLEEFPIQLISYIEELKKG